METLMAIMSLVQLGTGIWQSIKGSQAGKEEMPEYTTPKEVNESLNIAKQRAYGDMPGLQEAKANIEQTGATNYSRFLESASSGSDILGAVANQGVGVNRALQGLAVANANYKNQNLAALQAALMQKAGYADKEFQINEYAPWEAAMDSSAVLTEGGIQNIFGSVSGLTTNMLGYNNMQNQNKLLQKLYGVDNTKTDTSGDSIWSGVGIGGGKTKKTIHDFYDVGLSDINFIDKAMATNPIKK